MYCGYLWNKLPNQIVTHFGMSGDANDWGTKGEIFTIPIINVYFYIILWVVLYSFSTKYPSKNYYRIRLGLTIFIAALTFWLIQITVNATLS